MVGLAKNHQGEPFHVIASYCQKGAKDPTLKFLKTQGWSEELENISVMYQTTYSRDVKITYVPYYLIFDHTGRLRHHHMAGPYHGGNGDLYQEQVAALMKEVPKKEGKEVDRDGALSEVRGWTNLRGHTIEAALLGIGEELVKFRMRNGHTYNYPLEKLSRQSRDEIKRLAAEE